MEKSLPIWGGIECTINRIGNDYHDQLKYAGHYTRPGDIDAIAALGIAAFRYPILWERHQPTQDTVIDWTFARAGVAALMQRGIEPIIGLVHHGSGPAFTNFFDGSFERGLAAYAEQLAQAFPHANYFTPVNEPLTTARFCGLYGHWYPHKRDDYSFCKILLSECRATVMAMAAIKTINPSAKLVQTEDLGKTYTTPLLSYQADFENERRWLSYDLISGRVTSEHPLWGYLINAGIEESELAFFREDPCPIDIMGLNYYITSERYLDEEIEKYPAHTHGGNGEHQYADVEVVRVRNAHTTGFTLLVKEAWERFNWPVAITEVHIHCTREEQLRWFTHIYKASQDLLASGIDIKGVTCWAMLGAFGWDCLLTEPGGNYEPGAFRLSQGQLQPTALSALISQLASGSKTDHPLLLGRGWWHCNQRILYASGNAEPDVPVVDGISPVLIIGINGTLGSAFARVCRERNIRFIGLTHAELSVANPAQLASVLKKYGPWAIINASGYVRVDEAESDPGNCFTVNTQGPINLAVFASALNIGLVNFSSDLVFNGEKSSPYTESDTTNPLNTYGHSKALAEESVMNIYPGSLMIRTSAFFGPGDQYNFAYAALKSVSLGVRFPAANDILVSPTYVPDLVNHTLDLLVDGERGIWHLSNDGVVTWSEFAAMVVTCAGLDTYLVDHVSNHHLENSAKRPVNSSMKSERGVKLPTLESAIERFVQLSGMRCTPNKEHLASQ